MFGETIIIYVKVRNLPTETTLKNGYLEFQDEVLIIHLRLYANKTDRIFIHLHNQQTNQSTWNSKQPLFNGWFNWMITNLYMENGCFTKRSIETTLTIHLGVPGLSLQTTQTRVRGRRVDPPDVRNLVPLSRSGPGNRLRGG